MFTGIIQELGIVEEIQVSGSNKTFLIRSSLAPELRPEESVSHNGVCLTIEEILQDRHRVTAVEETLKKTNLGHWGKGTSVNLERCLPFNGRLDGHLVQGHVDATATCTEINHRDGSIEFSFSINPGFSGLIIEKGSITVNGISLTAFNTGEKGNVFTVAIVPYTLQHTNMITLQTGSKVNIEFDMIGKYVERILQSRSL